MFPNSRVCRPEMGGKAQRFLARFSVLNDLKGPALYFLQSKNIANAHTSPDTVMGYYNKSMHERQRRETFCGMT